MFHYQRKLKHIQNDIKNTWNIRKEIVDKEKVANEINNKKTIARALNERFVNISPTLAKYIGPNT